MVGSRLPPALEICARRLLADKIDRRLDNFLYNDTAISPASTSALPSDILPGLSLCSGG